MTPEEHQLITDLFERLRSTSNTPQDPEATQLITESMKAQPQAVYFLVQSLLIQNHALSAAEQRIRELQAQAPAPSSTPTSFMGAPRPSPWGPPPQQQQQPAPMPTSNPMGWAPLQQNAPQSGGFFGGGSGGFLQNALSTAASVAGGMMLANTIQGLFSGHSIAGSLNNSTGNNAANTPASTGDTTVNNYYEAPQTSNNNATPVNDQNQDAQYEQADWNDTTGDDDSGSGGDDNSGYDV